MCINGPRDWLKRIHITRKTYKVRGDESQNSKHCYFVYEWTTSKRNKWQNDEWAMGTLSWLLVRKFVFDITYLYDHDGSHIHETTVLDHYRLKQGSTIDNMMNVEEENLWFSSFLCTSNILNDLRNDDRFPNTKYLILKKWHSLFFSREVEYRFNNLPDQIWIPFHESQRSRRNHQIRY